jgi:dihydroorotate dehydrogenase
MIPQSTVLITGGTGFLGVHLARYFLKKKYKVILLDTAEQTAKDLFGKVTVINCDIRDYKKMEPYFSNVDYVVHAAAALPIHHNRNYIFDVNVNGTRNVLKASQKNKVKKVVFISTTAMYGVPRTLPEKETDKIYPIGYYGESKAVAENYFDYFEINISCPNLVHLPESFVKFDTPIGLKNLLDKLSTININKPAFIKMYSEKSIQDTLSLCQVAENYNFISGFIFSNLVKDRNNEKLDRREIEKLKNQKGNFSGKPTEELANNLISEVYKKYKDTNRFIIIGCGGIFGGKDAYEKIKRGASLLQMITGMIYEGPSQIGIINNELVDLLKKDGHKNISQAVGSYYK